MKVRLTSAAWRDLHAIGDWLAQSDPAGSIVLTDTLLDKAEGLGGSPFLYPQVPKLGRPELRKCSHRGYIIYYHLGPRVQVLRIAHERRDQSSILAQL